MTGVQSIFVSEAPNASILDFEKFLVSKNLFSGLEAGDDFTQWKTGKWSDNLEINIVVENSLAFEFVIMWSIIEAECGVHRVGFVTICRRPNEKSWSINSVTKSHFPYFKTSRF